MKTMTQQEYEKVMGDHQYAQYPNQQQGLNQQQYQNQQYQNQDVRYLGGAAAGINPNSSGFVSTSAAAAEPYREIPALFKELQAVEAELENSLQRLFARLAPVTSLYDKSADGRNESCPSPTAQTELGESIRGAVVRLIAMRDLVLNYTAALQL